MSTEPTISKPSLLLGCTAAFALFWVIARACVQSITIDEADTYLGGVAKRLNLLGCDVRTTGVLGKSYEALGLFATENNVDLVIIATHGRSGVSRFVWGSVADRLLRSVCVPVLMVRAPGCVPGI